jgi:hypothetical protein
MMCGEEIWRSVLLERTVVRSPCPHTLVAQVGGLVDA